MQAPGNRQGTGAVIPIELGERFSSAEREIQEKARHVYNERLEAGVPREQARKDLPLSTYTEAYWKIDLHNLLHFLNLRMAENAQKEIRAYATIIGEEIVVKWVPIVWEAFLDYRRHALQLSSVEARIIFSLNSKDPETAKKIAADSGLLKRRADGTLAPNGERTELDVKLRLLGLTPPWS
jgi:thymidylate synthase (FAD)